MGVQYFFFTVWMIMQAEWFVSKYLITLIKDDNNDWITVLTRINFVQIEFYVFYVLRIFTKLPLDSHSERDTIVHKYGSIDHDSEDSRWVTSSCFYARWRTGILSCKIIRKTIKSIFTTIVSVYNALCFNVGRKKIDWVPKSSKTSI